MAKIDVNEKLLEQILRDPLLMEKLSHRVYELLRDEIRTQQERSIGYGSR
jgi:hypothetical protein